MSIKPEDIPPEVAEAAAIEALFSDTPEASMEYKRLVWRTIGYETKQKYRETARAAILAALSAWPNKLENGHDEGLILTIPAIILPLPQKEPSE